MPKRFMHRVGAACVLIAGACFAPAASAQPHRPFALSDVGFDDICVPNAAFLRLLTLFSGPTAPLARGEVPELDEPLYDAVSGRLTYRLTFHEPVEWNGLHLQEVRLLQGIESGPSDLALVFFDPPDRVRSFFDDSGWELPPIGEWRLLPHSEVIEEWLGLSREGDLTIVECSSD